MQIVEPDPLDLPRFLQRRNTVTCNRCKVEVYEDKIHDPLRCRDEQCPLKPKESA